MSADKYVSEAGFLKNKEELPNGIKVDIVRLGNLLSEAAFAYLFTNKHIDLKTSTKKLLGVIPKKVVLASRTSDGSGLAGLEKALFDLSDNVDVYTVMNKFIGQERPVPWYAVSEFTKESLVNSGYLIKEEISKKIIVTFKTYKYHLNPEKSYDIPDPVSSMNEKLKEFSRQEFYNLLVKSIDAGINSQKEKADYDSD